MYNALIISLIIRLLKSDSQNLFSENLSDSQNVYCLDQQVLDYRNIDIYTGIHSISVSLRKSLVYIKYRCFILLENFFEKASSELPNEESKRRELGQSR